MRRSSNKATFFSQKSKVLNASIINELRSYCSDRVFELVGLRLIGSGQPNLSFVTDSSADTLLDYFNESIYTMAPSETKEYYVKQYTEAYAWARRFAALSSKNLSIPLGVDTRQAAFDKFMEAEHQCRLFNREYATMFDSAEPICGRSARSVVELIRQKIQSYLGDVPVLSELHCSFGPGSNSTCRKRTSAKWKLSSRLAIAEDGVDALNELITLYPRLNWKSLDLSDPTARYGVLSSTNKKATIDRMINIEPILNTFVQKPIGSVMKRRLSRSGCNLYDQTRNREMARKASLNNGAATVDMTSASDLIAFMCGKLLLSYEWFNFLATWRTDKVIWTQGDEERVICLEKFSSMGNGYTFELESCIFLACAHVARELVGNTDPSTVSVYGDDIILPREAIPALMQIFSLLKFQLNESKSFVDGAFRESCGGDYLLGVDVRPFYVKGCFSDARLTSMSNHVARSSYPDEKFRSLIESFILLRFKRYGPDGYGDGHLIDHPDRETLQPSHRKDGWAGSCFRTFVKVPKVDNSEPVGSELLPSYCAYINESPFIDDPEYEPKDRTCAMLNRIARLHRWDDRAIVNNILLGARVSGREADPNVLRGGDTAREIRVYLLDP